MAHYHLQGYAQLLQTAIVMVFALLIVLTYGQKAYSHRGWWVRLLSMVVVFVLLGAADLWLNESAGGKLDNGIGTGLHYDLLIVVALIALGTFIATFRATIRKSRASGNAPVPADLDLAPTTGSTRNSEGTDLHARSRPGYLDGRDHHRTSYRPPASRSVDDDVRANVPLID